MITKTTDFLISVWILKPNGKQRVDIYMKDVYMRNINEWNRRHTLKIDILLQSVKKLECF